MKWLYKAKPAAGGEEGACQPLYPIIEPEIPLIWNKILWTNHVEGFKAPQNGKPEAEYKI